MKKICTLLLTVAALATPRLGFALSDSAGVPVFLYHSWEIHGCGPENNAPMALERDLEIFRAHGFTVVPVYWIALWARQQLPGSALPAKVVGITFDDGFNRDWIDGVETPFEQTNQCTLPNGEPAPMKSFRTVLAEFKARHPDLPWYSPHASNFVVASPVARQMILGTSGTDDWWYAAQNSGIMEIYNHSADHDHDAITEKVFDAALQIYLAVGGNVDQNWKGEGHPGGFRRIGMDTDGTTKTSTYEVVKAAQYIQSKIGVYPDLFAFPYGGHSTGLDTYFQTRAAEHNTYAAFSTSGQYVRRGSAPYNLGRFVNQDHWSSRQQMESLLRDAGQPPSATFYMHGQPNGSITLPAGTPFTLSYTSDGAAECDLTGYANGSLWYSLPNFGTSFNWGTLSGWGPGNYTWVIVCRDTFGQTTQASASLYMPPQLSAAFYINGETNGSITLPAGTPFTLSYTSAGATSCDLAGYANGSLWYSLPNFGTSFNWGTESGWGPGNYTWVIVCRDTFGQTTQASASLYMPPPPSAVFYINGEPNGNIALAAGTPFTLSYTSAGTTSCDLTGYANGSLWYTLPGFSTSFDFGTVTDWGHGTYSWSILCRSAYGETTWASASLTMQ
jgi:hypothetical protein